MPPRQDGAPRSSVLATALGAGRSSAVARVVSKLRHIVSFSGDDELLRASPVTKVLRHQAVILSHREGSADTYALSSPCSSIDVFISHNWVVGRASKFMVLSYHFNWWLAASASLLLHLALLGLTATGWLPTVRVAWSEHPRGVACRALWNPLFLLLLCFGGDIRACLRLREPCVFLDKTCIHQTDPEIQRQGILRLGAFLRHSRRMLVIYTDQYLCKLWTVFEFACFLSLHPISDVQLRPTAQPRSVYVALIMLSVLHPVTMLLEHFTGGTRYGHAAAIAALLPLLCMTFRWAARERQAMHQRFRSFSVADCSCACEEDRPVVYGKIAQLVRASKLAAGNATEGEALLAFSKAARAKLPALVEAGMGRVGHKYMEFLTMAVGLQGSYFLDKAAGAAFSMSGRELAAMAVTDAALIFGIYPMSLAGCSVALRHFMCLKGAAEVGLACVAAWLACGLGGAVWMLMGEMWERSGALQPGARLRWPFAAGNLLVVALLACATVAIYAPPGCCPGQDVGWSGEKQEAEEEGEVASRPEEKFPSMSLGDACSAVSI